MKYIPEYYSITKDEYIQSQKWEGKEVNADTLLIFESTQKACEEYKKDIIAAIDFAYKKHIEKFSGLNLVYSKTWGKS